MGFFQKALLYVLTISLGTMEVGLVLAYFSPAYSSITTHFNFSDIDESLFNSLSPIVAIFGGLAVQFLTNKFTRKLILEIGLIITSVGWVLLFITRKSFKFLLFIARVISGFGIGTISTISPIYVAELSPTNVRGSYGVMSQLFVSMGSTIGYLIGIWCEWRVIAYICIIPGIISFILIIFIPHSPFDQEPKVSENSSQEETHEPEKNKESLFSRKYAWRLIISLLLTVFQQFSGINALLTNLNPIFERSRIKIKSSVAALIVGLAQVFSNALSTPIVEKLGRRLLWAISSGGQTIFLVLSWANEKWNISPILPVVCLFFDVFIFGIGLGPLPWFVAPELFPDTVRSVAVSLTQACNWFLCSINVFIFPLMVSAMTIKWVYFFYGMVMVLSVLYAIFILPETMGQKMGEIEIIQEQNPPVVEDENSNEIDENSNEIAENSNEIADET